MASVPFFYPEPRAKLMQTASVAYTRPYLYPKQRDAFFSPSRYCFTEASTKAGKTVAAIAWILEQAFGGQDGQNFWWVAPISAQAKIAFTRIKNGLTKGSYTALESPEPRIILLNGAIIWFKSGDNPDSLYGEDVYAGVVDEASRVKEESWYALRSTLTATQGPVRVIGNVKGRKNWFFKLSRLAEAGTENMQYAKITVLDAIAAGVIKADELEDARRTLPEHVFRELYMAEASDDGGNPFGLQYIEACVHGLSNQPAVAYGIDLAKKQDWFVVIGLDAAGRTCHFSRWQHVPWAESIRRVHAIVGEDVPALVDSTGLGDPVLEQLQIGHGNFRGYNFTPLSKQRLMEGLAVSIQSHDVGFPEGHIRLELESFEYVIGRTGVRYSAPEGDGSHDDCVVALALAREQLTATVPGLSLMEFYAAQAQDAKGRVEALSAGLDLPEGTSAPSIENELTELYLATMAKYTPHTVNCRRCGKPTGGARVSDGQYVWHPECSN